VAGSPVFSRERTLAILASVRFSWRVLRIATGAFKDSAHMLKLVIICNVTRASVRGALLVVSIKS